MRRRVAFAASTSVTGRSASASCEERLLDREIGLELFVLSRNDRVLGIEEAVLRGLESSPECVVVGARGAAGFAPAIHQPFERRRCRCPVLARGESLGFLDQLLLGGPGLGLRVLEGGEVHPPSLVEGVASCAEALPKRSLGLSIQLGAGPLQGLPLVEEGTHARAAGLPLDLGLRLPGDRLRLEHELFALGLARHTGRAALSTLDGLLGLDGCRDLGQPGVQGGEVTDDVGLSGLLTQLGEPLSALPYRQIRVRHTLQEKIGGGEQLVILAGEVGQGLGVAGTRVGTHLSLTVGGAYEHGS